MQGLLFDNTELKKLILENPDLPLLVFASEEANNGEYYNMLASCNANKGIVLECDTKFCSDYIFTDKDEFEEELIQWMSDEKEFAILTDPEFDKAVEEKMKEYEPFWKECIILNVDGF